MSRSLIVLIVIALGIFLSPRVSYSSEDTPSIFSNTKCFGQVVPIVKPGAMSTIPSWDDGAIDSPPPPPPECAPAVASVTVNPGNFQSAIAGLGSGKTIVLAAGNYPSLRLSGKSFGGATIQCAEPSKCKFGSSKLAKVSGLTIEGIFIAGGSVGLDIDESKDITVRCSTFFEQANTGILLNPSINYQGNENIVIDRNVFSNNRIGCNKVVQDAGGGCKTEAGGQRVANMDYGIRIYDAKSVYIRQNIFGTIFNHAISFKDGAAYGLVEGNTFNNCERVCIQMGQEPNTVPEGYRSIKRVDFINNTLTGRASFGLSVQNIEEAVIKDNRIDVTGIAVHIDQDYGRCTVVTGGCPLLGSGFPPNRRVTQSGNIIK